MNARQKRLLRKEQAKKRKQLVQELYVIETTRCKGCTDRKRDYTEDRRNYKSTANQECGHCPYFKRLNELGGELLNLSSKHQKTLEERESTIMATNNKTQTSIAAKYERSGLTPERYREHKNIDKLTDDKISEMYSFPKSSFEKWKRDNGLVKTYKKDEAPVAKSEKPDAQLQRKHDKLKLEHDSLKSRYDETAERCRKLEQELVIEQEAHTMKSDLLNLLEKKLDVEKETSATKSELLLSLEADIKKLEQELQVHKGAFNSASGECSSCKELAEYKQIANGATLALESLRQEIATMAQQHDERDEEVVDAINKQMKRFDQYETLLLERILQLKREM